MREAICDTSPIQYLHQIGMLHLLKEFYSGTLIPPAVLTELERGRTLGINLPEIQTLPWLRIRAPEELAHVHAITDLDAGEREVLALGLQIPDSVVIVDERLGRYYAEALQLKFTGTLGLLLRARAEGQIPRIEPLIEHLNRLGFRLSASTRAAVLRQAGE